MTAIRPAHRAVVAASLAFFSCGLERDDPPGAAFPQRAPLAIQRIRILVKENFDAAAVENSHYGLGSLVRSGARRIHIFDGSARELASGSGFRLEPSPGRLIRLDGLTYRGSLEAFVNPLGEAVIVNELSLEDYLLGVVPNEMSPRQFPVAEALKAQSVAARTYAVSAVGGRAQLGFDLYADVRSQVYRGVASEQIETNRAVEQTRGVIAAYRGEPIVAFYSSTCGGQTADYQDVFAGPEIPYLKGGVKCSDQTSRYYRWKERLRPSDFQATLDRYAKVGLLKNLKTRRTDSAGRVLEMEFEGESGRVVLTSSDLRFALGLRSNLITSLKMKKDRLGRVTEIEIAGGGFGHGVGLCQIGAVELGRIGLTYRQIVQRYYPGVELVQAY